MKKKMVLFLVLILAILITAGVFLFKDKLMNNDAYSFSYHVNVEVVSGKAAPQSSETVFTVKEDGIHTISLSWLPMGKTIEEAMKLDPSELSFITGCVISSEDDPCVYATTGGWLTLDTDIDLKAGEYNINYYYLTDRDDYTEFADKYFGTIGSEKLADQIDWDRLKTDDKQVISYYSRVAAEGTYTGARLILLFVTIFLCALLIIVAYFIATQGKMYRFRYDERQEALRGKGFRIAFYAMIGYMLWIFLVDTMGFVSESYHTILYMAGMILGVSIYGVYAIWHDCYFAMNESRKSTIWIIAVIGFVNLLIGVFGLINLVRMGRMNPYGISGVNKIPIINLGLAIMFIVIFVTMILKKARTGKSAEEEEEA